MQYTSSINVSGVTLMIENKGSLNTPGNIVLNIFHNINLGFFKGGCRISKMIQGGEPNIIRLDKFTGGNSKLVNGYYIPLNKTLNSYPIYAKHSEFDISLTETTLSLHTHNNGHYSWLIHDSKENVIARIGYPMSGAPSLPEDIPSTQSWEMLSTGLFKRFKKKPKACLSACKGTEALSLIIPFIMGASRPQYDMVSEIIRTIGATIANLEKMLCFPNLVKVKNSIKIGLCNDDTMNQYLENMSLDDLSSFLVELTEGEGVTTTETTYKTKRERLLSDLADYAPEDFLDPITMTIMENPVKMPTSKYIMDRNTLAEHLAISKTDPFSRLPLDMSMTYPDIALKIRIISWVQYKMAGRNCCEALNLGYFLPIS